MDRSAYDALARRTWQLLKRGDAAALARELARGDGGRDSLGDIRDDELRRLVSAKLRETDDEYETLKRRESTSERSAILKRIIAGMYVPEDIRHLGSECKAPDDDSSKEIVLTTWVDLLDGTPIRVDLFRGDFPNYERARRDLQSLEDRRVEDITQLFEHHGLATTWPPK